MPGELVMGFVCTIIGFFVGRQWNAIELALAFHRTFPKENRPTPLIPIEGEIWRLKPVEGPWPYDWACDVRIRNANSEWVRYSMNLETNDGPLADKRRPLVEFLRMYERRTKLREAL